MAFALTARSMWVYFGIAVGLATAVLLFSVPWHPPVGVFIAILALLGVLVPLFRDIAKIGPREKALWTVAMFILVGLEIRSIYLDRDAHDREQANARAEQLKQFAEIAKGIDTTIDNGQRQFAATMKPLEQTLRNTQPYASLEFKKINGVSPDTVIGVNRQLEFDVDYTNAGNDVATNPQFDAKPYVRQPDDRGAEEEMARDFNTWWKTSKHQKELTPVRPGAPAGFRFRTSPLTQDERDGLRDHTKTIYVLLRFTWTDQTGQWINDECFWFFDVTRNFDGRPCEVHRRYRYTASLLN